MIAFRLASPFTTKTWDSTVDALVDSEILDAAEGARPTGRRQDLGLRAPSRSSCAALIAHQARARNLGSIDALQMSPGLQSRVRG